MEKERKKTPPFFYFRMILNPLLTQLYPQKPGGRWTTKMSTAKSTTHLASCCCCCQVAIDLDCQVKSTTLLTSSSSNAAEDEPTTTSRTAFASLPQQIQPFRAFVHALTAKYAPSAIVLSHHSYDAASNTHRVVVAPFQCGGQVVPFYFNYDRWKSEYASHPTFVSRYGTQNMAPTGGRIQLVVCPEPSLAMRWENGCGEESGDVQALHYQEHTCAACCNQISVAARYHATSTFTSDRFLTDRIHAIRSWLESVYEVSHGLITWDDILTCARLYGMNRMAEYIACPWLRSQFVPSEDMQATGVASSDNYDTLSDALCALEELSSTWGHVFRRRRQLRTGAIECAYFCVAVRNTSFAWWQTIDAIDALVMASICVHQKDTRMETVNGGGYPPSEKDANPVPLWQILPFTGPKLGWKRLLAYIHASASTTFPSHVASKIHCDFRNERVVLTLSARHFETLKQKEETVATTYVKRMKSSPSSSPTQFPTGIVSSEWLNDLFLEHFHLHSAETDEAEHRDADTSPANLEHLRRRTMSLRGFSLHRVSIVVRN